MMGTITVVLDDEVEAILRRLAMELYGGRRGSISKVVEDAIRLLAEKVEGRIRIKYKAFKGDKLVAEAGSLRELAEELGAKGIDPREVVILRSPPPKLRYRLGPRGQK